MYTSTPWSVYTLMWLSTFSTGRGDSRCKSRHQSLLHVRAEVVANARVDATADVLDAVVDTNVGIDVAYVPKRRLILYRVDAGIGIHVELMVGVYAEETVGVPIDAVVVEVVV